MRKAASNPRLWKPWRDPVFVSAAALTLVAVFGSSLYQPLYAARLEAWRSGIAGVPSLGLYYQYVTVGNLTEFIKLWFVLHMYEATWVAYDSFFWGVPGRLGWGLAVYVFGGPVLVGYKLSRPRRGRKLLELSEPLTAAA
jgi:hypothetical protein